MYGFVSLLTFPLVSERTAIFDCDIPLRFYHLFLILWTFSSTKGHKLKWNSGDEVFRTGKQRH